MAEKVVREGRGAVGANGDGLKMHGESRPTYCEGAERERESEGRGRDTG